MKFFVVVVVCFFLTPAGNPSRKRPPAWLVRLLAGDNISGNTILGASL